MSLERPASGLDDVRYGAIARFEDPRGSFREIWKASTGGAIDPVAAGAAAGSTPRFVQANLSTSAAGVLRGLHFHRRQLDHWVVATGRALVALVDVRPMLVDPSAAPRVETRELVADEWVEIPTGVAHGFLALEPLELIYLVTNEYDGSDELGFAWDDPTADVDWPAIAGNRDGRPILSERDQTNPSLAELVARLRSPD
ncbi:MAG: dTDP-4-dehydrorhamnose 3,5-epimerase family protein [Candidatus Limnocylindrales bacterium]